MILLTDKPPAPQGDMGVFYERMSREGLVHSTMMCGERYEKSAAFDDAWGCDAISWSSGGREVYDFEGDRSFVVKSAGVISIRGGDRYAYEASDEAPFRSNMIAFPRWIIEDAKSDMLEDKHYAANQIETRQYLAGAEAEAMMAAMIFGAKGNPDDAHHPAFAETAVLLHSAILADQARLRRAQNDIPSQKRSTRAELARRAARAKDYMLSNYDDPALTLDDLASHACLSVYHLIRVFKAWAGKTPIQFLTQTRMRAAMRLLHESDYTVQETIWRVGYNDRAAFYRAFRREYGLSPSQARLAGSL